MMEEIKSSKEVEELELGDRDVQMAILVTLLRIYDVLSAAEIEKNPEGKVSKILAMHEEGLINGAPPALRQP